MNYKAGDSFRGAARGKSNQPVVFIDTTGRSYSLDSRDLPSARGQGEPLTGKLTLPAGATVEHVLMAPDEQKFLMASDAGYGFICNFSDLVAKNRAGKALITLPENARVLTPLEITHPQDDMLLAITSSGRMLMFPVADLPQLSKGKGNKIISVQSVSENDLLSWLLILSPQSSITLYFGKRKLTLRPEDLQKFRAERGRKGTPLPRGLQRIERVQVETPSAIA